MKPSLTGKIVLLLLLAPCGLCYGCTYDFTGNTSDGALACGFRINHQGHPR